MPFYGASFAYTAFTVIAICNYAVEFDLGCVEILGEIQS